MLSQRVMLPLAAATLVTLVSLSAFAHASSMTYFRTVGLVSGTAATRAGMLAVVASGQLKTLALWLMGSAILCLLLRLWLPVAKSSFVDCVALVGVSHVPLVIWTALAALVTSEGVGLLDGYARWFRWSPRNLDASLGHFLFVMSTTKAIGYAAAAVMCGYLVGESEGLSRSQSAGIVAATVVGIVMVNGLG